MEEKARLATRDWMCHKSVNYCYENIIKLTTFVDINSCVVYQHWAPVYIPLLTLECWYSPQLLVRLLFCHPASYSGPMVKIQVKRLCRWFRGLIRSMLPYHHLPLGNPPFAALLLLCFNVVEIQNPGMCSVILSSSQLWTMCLSFLSVKIGDYVCVSERQGEDLGGGISVHNGIWSVCIQHMASFHRGENVFTFWNKFL